MSENQPVMPPVWIYFPCQLISLALFLFIMLIKVVTSSSNYFKIFKNNFFI